MEDVDQNLSEYLPALFPQGFYEFDEFHQRCLGDPVELPPPDLPSHDAILFQRSYLQRLDFKSITLPPEHELKQPECQAWMHRIILLAKDEHVPGTLGYTSNDKRLFRHLATLLEKFAKEDEDTETNDELMEFLAERIAQPDLPEMEAAKQEIKVHYTLLYDRELPFWNGSGITIFEQPRLLTAGAGNGYRTWEAALHLVGFLHERPSFMKCFIKKTVLELGAGTGLVSFTSLLNFKAKHVYATDGDPEVVSRLLSTLRRNFDRAYHRSITCKAYKWGQDIEAALDGPDGRDIDTVVATDVTYDPSLFPAFFDTLDMLMERNPEVLIFVCLALRNRSTLNEFIEQADERRLRLRLCEYWPQPLKDQQTYLYETDVPMVTMLISAMRFKTDPNVP